MTNLIRLTAVREITGRSRSSIYADPTFPRPVKIGHRAVAWVENEVREWVEQRVRQRDEGGLACSSGVLTSPRDKVSVRSHAPLEP